MGRGKSWWDAPSLFFHLVPVVIPRGVWGWVHSWLDLGALLFLR